ncbi:MAG: hypothetical protein AB1832_13340 [Pseudomonadota bacterium]
MNNTINLLESLGANASLRYAGPSQLAETLNAYETPESILKAILNADARQLRISIVGTDKAVPTQVTQNPWCAVQVNLIPWVSGSEALSTH